MNILSLHKDILILIALELEYYDIINLCKSHVKFNEKIYKQDNDFWRNKLLKDFGHNKEHFSNLFLLENEDVSNKYIYKLIYSLNVIKKVFKMKETIYDIYQMKKIYLHNNEIKEIPKEIGQLKNLKYLWLHNNKIKNIPLKITHFF